MDIASKRRSIDKVDRVPTGFDMLDRMLEGGLPQKTVTLLSGACGTGKSTFAMQFLYHGAKYDDEPGVYVTLEETPSSLISNMALFGWDLQKLIEEKKLIVIKPEIYKFDSLKQIISDSIDKIKAKRLVVDSYSVLLTYFSDPNQIRNGLVQLDREIKKMGCTAIVISDIRDNAEIFSTTGVEEFIVDGVIVLSLLRAPDSPFRYYRAISIRKMRATNHPLTYHAFSIDKSGINIGEAINGVAGKGKGAFAQKPERLPRLKKSSRKADAGKPEEIEKKTRISISDLRGRSGHSWKWKHL